MYLVFQLEMREVKFGYLKINRMALFTVLANEFEEEILPLTFSNSVVKFSNDNITFAQFEYNTNQV